MTVLTDYPTPAQSEKVTDAELLSRTRRGDSRSYAALWLRHSDAGHAAARSFTRSFDAEDLVTEAFARILTLIRDGRGPETAFRTYLVQTIRHLAVDWSRGSKGDLLIGDWEELASPLPDPIVGDDRPLVLRAFNGLPERWRQILWYMEIENMKPRDLAPLLGMSTNSVSALACRAREGLRQTWIRAHLVTVEGDSDHEWTVDRLGAYARHNITAKDRTRLEKHLEECEGCWRAAKEAIYIGNALPQ